MPSFEFSGGKTVQSSSDPVQLYRGFVEYSLRSHWTRPENTADDDYVAEVEVSLDRNGTLSDPQWKKGSGDSRWDDSVRAAIAATKSLDRAPPASFPSRIVVRFDVQDAIQPFVQCCPTPILAPFAIFHLTSALPRRFTIINPGAPGAVGIFPPGPVARRAPVGPSWVTMQLRLQPS
jgi:hypothetical protein